MLTQENHMIFNRPLNSKLPPGTQEAMFGMGCFWGAERLFWQQEGVFLTAVGYSGGETSDPDYQSVCTGRTGHAEVVWVAFDPSTLSYESLLSLFWTSHNPTQGNRQGNDIGTQYRSAIYTYSPEQLDAAHDTKARYQTQLIRAGFSMITTEIQPVSTFFIGESYHQQYLAKHPNGYCGLAGTGVTCVL